MNRRLMATAGIAVSTLILAACSGESTSVTTVYEPEDPAPIETPIEMEKPDPVTSLPTVPTSVTPQQFRDWFTQNAEEFTTTMNTDQAYTWQGEWTGTLNGLVVMRETLTATINPDGSLRMDDVWAVADNDSINLREKDGFILTWICEPTLDGGQCWFKDSKLPYWQEMKRGTRQQILFPAYLSKSSTLLFPNTGTYEASSMGRGNFQYVNGGLASAVVKSLKKNSRLEPNGDVELQGTVTFRDDTFSETDSLRIPFEDRKTKETIGLDVVTTLTVAPSDPVEVVVPDPTEVDRGKGLQFIPLL